MDKGRRLLGFSALLGLSILGCALLYGIRVVISGRPSYLYLVQNILLAFVPFLIAAASVFLVSTLGSRKAKAWMALPAVLLWLIFYPNAPYIFTDFIHVFNRVYLRVAPGELIGLKALIWYDIVMNAAFAFIGHFIGLASMWIMQTLLDSVWGRLPSLAVLGLAMVLAGFGIYLGRFSRLNSWDVLFSPFRVAGELAEAVSDPMAIFFSLAFALFILLSYGAMAAFKGITLLSMDEDR